MLSKRICLFLKLLPKLHTDVHRHSVWHQHVVHNHGNRHDRLHAHNALRIEELVVMFHRLHLFQFLCPVVVETRLQNFHLASHVRYVVIGVLARRDQIVLVTPKQMITVRA